MDILRRWFPASSGSVPQARMWVRDQLVDSSADGPLVELLVTELTTNAVRHARGDRFLVEVGSDRDVTVVVSDLDPTAPKMSNAAPGDSGGRGLAIVARLSDGWGSQIRKDGKCLWFVVSGPSPSDDG